jgi:hypothetical protein
MLDDTLEMNEGKQRASWPCLARNQTGQKARIEIGFSPKRAWIWTKFVNERHIIGYDHERCFKDALAMDFGCGLILRR